MFLEHRGVLDLPTTNMGNFSPIALAAAVPVNRTLLFFPPEHFSLGKCYVLVGRFW